MTASDEDAFRAVMAAERALMDHAVRTDRETVEAMLAPDFVEIGRSGRLWSRSEIVAALDGEVSTGAPGTDEWRCQRVSEDLVLVTFRVDRADRSSRHASLWDVSGDRPVLRFHQGTVVPTDDGVGVATRVDESRSNIVAVLARTPVASIEAALPLYQRLAATDEVRAFAFGSVRLAWVGPFLLLESTDGVVPPRSATIIVRDVTLVVALVLADGGELVEGPMPGPNGRRLIARHPDGNVLEYIEQDRQAG
jgi:predicted enzyme related to lactoylglutathione lyase